MEYSCVSLFVETFKFDVQREAVLLMCSNYVKKLDLSYPRHISVKARRRILIKIPQTRRKEELCANLSKKKIFMLQRNISRLIDST